MLRTDTIEESTLVLLKKLQQMPLLSELRLVGGTSLALQLGHRLSIDLDLFGTFNATNQELQIEFYNNNMHVASLNNSNRIHIFQIDGIKVDIVNYPFKWLKPLIEIDGIRLADMRDIAAMKLEAITNRGTKKDFVDFYFLLQHFSLKEMLDFYAEKYNKESLFSVIKSLDYFADAESDFMPEMLIPVSWEKIKSTIQRTIANF